MELQVSYEPFKVYVLGLCVQRMSRRSRRIRARFTRFILCRGRISRKYSVTYYFFQLLDSLTGFSESILRDFKHL